MATEPWKEPADIDHGRVKCRVCGVLSEVPGAQMCNGCWGLGMSFSGLAHRNPSAALEWLKSMGRIYGLSGGAK